MTLPIRSVGAKLLASYIVPKRMSLLKNPKFAQQQIFSELLHVGKHTAFGKEHHFDKIQQHADFVKNVPLRDYEQLSPYIERIIKGEENVLWNGKPVYFAKTSGTTSGTKYIPITRDSVPNHINSARDALLFYVWAEKKPKFLDGKLIFLSGSPELDKKGGILTGRLSGIANHHVPSYLRGNQKPSYSTNCIEDWEQKLDKIVAETVSEDMSLISGIPPWVQMYFDKLTEKTGKSVSEIFPNFSLFVYGGVNFAPYSAKIFNSVGKIIPSVETFPASEGFFAFQNEQTDEGLLLLCDSGIFFEFVPVEELFSQQPTRLTVEDVELDKVYALVINSNAGLWGYVIGDLVKFTQKNPHKIVFAGRAKHFTSAFGEHVIAEEVEKALAATLRAFPDVLVREFTVAPVVNPAEGLPHHEWLTAFDAPPLDVALFAQKLDGELRKLNVYYDDLIAGNILKSLQIKSLPPDIFIQYMKSLGKLGGQNKVPRLSNDYKMA